mmetsp:Transcript_54419/g.129293  ORF Transcript_54419/g.129293 Transcript_54419/m.129293 type:complete len:209 (+) Transcript_54419:1033-1659(+)
MAKADVVLLHVPERARQLPVLLLHHGDAKKLIARLAQLLLVRLEAAEGLFKVQPELVALTQHRGAFRRDVGCLCARARELLREVADLHVVLRDPCVEHLDGILESSKPLDLPLEILGTNGRAVQHRPEARHLRVELAPVLEQGCDTSPHRLQLGLKTLDPDPLVHRLSLRARRTLLLPGELLPEVPELALELGHGPVAVRQLILQLVD